MELAYAQGGGLRAESEDAVRTASRQLDQLVASSRVIALPEVAPVPGARLTSEGTRARSAVYAVARAGLASAQRLIQERLAAGRRQFLTVIGGLTLALLIGGVLAYLIVRGLTRQVASVQETFSRIGIGDFEARVEVTSDDELGQLSRNLNAMLDNTLALIQTAEEKDRIQTSIRTLLDEVSGVADGDLSAEAEVTAEMTGAIADAFNFMIDQLRSIIRDVQRTTHSVSGSANEVRQQTELIAEGSQAQAKRIALVSTAIEAMTESIQSVSSNAEDAAGVARNALESAKTGNTAVRNTIGGMEAIRTQVQTTAKRMKLLGESSQEIGEIVQLIGEISERTSVLAFNASIQAANAGEAGRGFAVVAEEVERLAERSADASKKIDDLIQSVQTETSEALTAMESTTELVVAGSGLANNAGEALAQIETTSEELATLIESITASSRRQSDSSQSVAGSMSAISQVTADTVRGTERAALSVQQLTELADRLRASVSAFRLPAEEQEAEEVA